MISGWARGQHHRAGRGTLRFRPCAVPLKPDSRTGTACPPGQFFFPAAKVRTELPVVGSSRPHPSGIAPLLAGTRNQHRTGEKRMQGTALHPQRQAIGFPNVAGGYEVRNSFFKGCIAPKDITHIRQQGEQREKCLVFEGFMDYLSFLTLRVKNCPAMPNLDRQDYIILNAHPLPARQRCGRLPGNASHRCGIYLAGA